MITSVRRRWRPGDGCFPPPTSPWVEERVGVGAVTCQPGFGLAWTFMPQLSGSYVIVPGFQYRAVVGVFGGLAKGAANPSSVKSQAEGQGFTDVQVWSSPTDQGFPGDWQGPPTKASLGTSDNVFYVQGTATGAQRTMSSAKSTLGQGAEVIQAFNLTCQPGGVAGPTPQVSTPSSGSSTAIKVLAAVAVAGFAFELWKHFKKEKRK